ncbi:hypothetical protein PC39_00245 [Salinisphaera sp. PC39]|uniref:PIN domain-containing protein n=1 Tax=Salinisphaera sp. PC39 TaxID=1304156 RepID=UPI0033413D62
MTPAVVDTNVVAAGLLSADRHSPVCRILDAMLVGDMRCLLSDQLLAEYRRVLLRPKLCARHGLPAEGVDRLLTEIVRYAVFREPVAAPPAPDRGDDHLWRLLAAIENGLLVTGDRALIAAPPAYARVEGPSGFLVRLKPR